MTARVGTSVHCRREGSGLRGRMMTAVYDEQAITIAFVKGSV